MISHKRAGAVPIPPQNVKSQRESQRRFGVLRRSEQEKSVVVVVVVVFFMCVYRCDPFIRRSWGLETCGRLGVKVWLLSGWDGCCWGEEGGGV